MAVVTGIALAIALLAGSRAERAPAPPPPPLDREAARGHADRACVAARDAEESIGRNESSERVFEQLRAADREARTAVDRDPVWVQLLSGIQSVRYALEHDDPRAAATGIEIVRRECPATP